MTIRRPVLTSTLLAVTLAVALTGCSSKGSTASSSATGGPAAASTSGAASSAAGPASPGSAAAATEAASAGSGGVAGFCAAFKEFKAANETETPQLKGAGYRAAAAHLRTFAPAEIKAAAGLFADVLDEVGKAVEGGKQGPELIGAGQSAERRQGLADSIAWIGKNCPA